MDENKLMHHTEIAVKQLPFSAVKPHYDIPKALTPS